MSNLALPAAVLIGAGLCAAGCASGVYAHIKSGDLAQIEATLPQSKYRSNAGPTGYACQTSQMKSLRFLVEKGAMIEENGVVGSALFACIVKGQAEMVAYLLSKNANIASRDIKYARGRYPAIYDMLVAELARRASGGAPAVAVSAPAAPATPYARRETLSDVDSPSRRGAERPDDFALVIGVEEYQSLPKADYGVRDAQTMRKHLEALGFPARNIISLEGWQATGSKLKSYLEEWLPLNVKPTSTLFVYYSGHGAPDPQTGDAYLVPWDGDATFLKSTAYPLKKFYADLSKTKAKRVLVALDACFSGAGGRSVLAQGARPLVAKVADVPVGERVTVLAAASGEEITGSLNEQGHGMFTYFFLKGLAEGKKTARELHDYLSPKVQDEARRQNRQQSPALIGKDAPF